LSNILKADARTAWAFYVYSQVAHNPQISDEAASIILGALEPEEHAEVLFRWERVESSLVSPKEVDFDKHRHSLGMRTIDRFVFLAPTGDEVYKAQAPDFSFVTRVNEYVNEKEWYKTYNLKGGGVDEILVYTPGKTFVEYLDKGVGEAILKLPPQPGVSEPPKVLSPVDGGGTIPLGKQFLSDWKSAEEVAESHLQALGFPDVRRTGSGTDSGIDISGTAVAAQVKMTALPVGRPTVQQLMGASQGAGEAVCYSTSGYTSEAIAYAAETDAALFRITPDGDVVSENERGRRLEHTAHQTPHAAQWRSAYAFKDGVVRRVEPYILHFRNAVEEANKETPRAIIRSFEYMLGAMNYLREVPPFSEPRELVIHYHHLEQLAAFWASYTGIPYPYAEVVPKRNLSASDFY